MEIVEFIKQPSYIKIRVAKTDVALLAKWVLDTQCGKRVSMFHFAFQNEAEYAMFLLRWSPTGILKDNRRYKEESSL